MSIRERYARDGYVHLEALFTPQITRAFLQGLKADMGEGPVALSAVDAYPNLLRRPAFEVYGHLYKPMQYFLFGLTPMVSELVGRPLLPTYDYFRLYREGDVCRVHCDRYSCEHSLSLTIDYSDGEPWALEMACEPCAPTSHVADDFEGAHFAAIRMAVGDAVLYRGVEHRHGRTTPNPNGWSAHLFLHWVDRDGPHAAQAFDGRMSMAAVNFSFS